jgi:hypothetical protein
MILKNMQYNFMILSPHVLLRMCVFAFEAKDGSDVTFVWGKGRVE